MVPSVQRNDSIGMSKRSYMEAVVNGLKAVSAVDVDFAPGYLGEGNPRKSGPVNDICNGTTRRKIFVRLLLSIDRRETTADAMETVSNCMCALRMFWIHVLLISNAFNFFIGYSLTG